MLARIRCHLFLYVSLFAMFTDGPLFSKEKYPSIETAVLHPTQLVLGRAEVNWLTVRLRAMSASELSKYIETHPVKVVFDPAGKAYVIDGHHLVTAAKRLKIENLQIKVAKTFTEADGSFWETMVRKKWTYLKDENGKPVSPEEIERMTFEQMRDDPYRTLSWLLRKNGVYEDMDTPFQEFDWAEFLRTKIVLPTDLNEISDWMDYADRSIKFVISEEAKNLPGWTGKFKGKCTFPVDYSIALCSHTLN